MKLKSIIATFLLLASALVSNATAFEEANRKFSAGDFQAAAAAYEKILADEGPDAAVYYNLGNAYQSLKKQGPAILAYERARLLAPRDPDLLANLALARKAATAFEEPGGYPRLDAFLQQLSRDEWSWLVGGGALVLGAVALLMGLIRMRVRWMRQLAAVVAGCAAVLIAAGSAALYLRRAEAGRGVVLSEQAVVRLSPFEKAESLGTAGAGRTVRLGEEKAGFRYVEIPGTNLRGWLAGPEVAAIIPDHPEK